MARTIRHLLALGAVVATGYVAAPALSSNPYLPEAVDFEQPLPALARVEARARPGASGGAHEGHPGEGQVTHRSAVIEAPERFDLVGLAGELRPLELRARDAGGEWSDWVETANGDPVYFGGGEEVQLRSRGWRPSGTLHYVNVSGTTSGANSMLTSLRKSINGAFVSVSTLIQPEAEAAPARPLIVKRGAWGANREEGGCPPRAGPSFGTVKAAAVHHTVTSDKYSEAEAPAIVLGICRYHRNANGWNDIGYNALVDRFGNIYAGRAGGVPRPIVGAHAQGFNAQTTGVAAIGTHSANPIGPETMEGFISLLAWKLSKHDLPATGRATLVSAGGDANRYPSGREVRINHIFGHGRVNHTACPGKALGGQLGMIRRRIAERMAESDGSVEPPPVPPPVPPVPGRADSPQGAR